MLTAKKRTYGGMITDNEDEDELNTTESTGSNQGDTEDSEDELSPVKLQPMKKVKLVSRNAETVVYSSYLSLLIFKD